MKKSENNKYLLWLLINVINVVQYSKTAVILLNTTNRINTQETDVISLHFALRVILNIQKNRNLTFKYLWFYKKIHVSYIGLPTLSTLPTLCSISMLWKNCGKHNKTNKADVYLLKMNSKVKKIKKQKKELNINFLNAKIFKSNYICYSLFHVKEQFVRYISNVSNVIYC